MKKRDLALASLLISGVLLASSEGPYFPYPNLAGAALMLACVHIVRKVEW